jgi:hypothetical protein
MEDFDASTNLQSESVLQAEVVFSANSVNNLEGRQFPIESEGFFDPVEDQMSPKKGDRRSQVLLFTVLYGILILSIAFLAVSIHRYVAMRSNRNPSPFSKEDATIGTVANLNGIPASVAVVDPDREPASYRSDIEFILSTEMDEATNFLEGPQKMAIDWLVYEDLVLSSTKVRAMIESRDRNSIEGDDFVPTFSLVQRYAMMVLFFGTNGELWLSSPWAEMVDIDECRFTGVECDLDGQVVLLDLAFRKLRGRLPEEVGMLTNLESVSFMSNSLEGTIPSFIYNKLTNLSTCLPCMNIATQFITGDDYL